MNFLFSKKNNKAHDNHQSSHNSKGNMCAVYSVSETGPTREHNEDYLAFSFMDIGHQNLIAVVADGMGGHNAGEVASQMACDLLLDYCMKHWDKRNTEKLIQKAFISAYQEIIATGEANAEQKGMGTTASMVIIHDDSLHIGHIGDSRIYLLCNGSLEQLSTDHTLVNQMFESGEITEEERDNHPMNNVLIQALGTTPTIHPQISSDGIEVSEGNRIFLCSDGVYDALSVEDIKELLLMKRPEFVLECLSAMANTRKVSDNFSALLIDISAMVQSNPSVTREQNIPS